ncbi:2106_t:CDS:2, partial [Ambispora leptoticha]
NSFSLPSFILPPPPRTRPPNVPLPSPPISSSSTNTSTATVTMQTLITLPSIPPPPTPPPLTPTLTNLESLTSSLSITPEPAIELSDDDQLDPDYADEIAASLERAADARNTASSTLSYYFSNYNNNRDGNSNRRNITENTNGTGIGTFNSNNDLDETMSSNSVATTPTKIPVGGVKIILEERKPGDVDTDTEDEADNFRNQLLTNNASDGHDIIDLKKRVVDSVIDVEIFPPVHSKFDGMRMKK